MDIGKSFEAQIYTVNEATFGNIALLLFRYQARHNAVYRRYIEARNVQPDAVRTLHEIPYLPIDFFKFHDVKTGDWQAETSFTSSGTTQQVTSTVPVRNINFYLQNSRRCFEFFFGPLTGYHFMALLPSYLERQHSSLVAMMQYFIRASESPQSGFYLNDLNKLVADIRYLKKSASRKIVLWGVPFALLDLAERFSPDLSGCLVFETGGMKGRRAEITREELHYRLLKGLNAEAVYAEYGMTELLSQAYTRGTNSFFCPPWMRVLARQTDDPLTVGITNKTGGLNVIDLANINTAAFLETGDIGKVTAEGSFEVLGRLDNTDIRGCNLLAE